MSLLLGDMLVRYKADVTDLKTKSDEAKKNITDVAHAAKGGGMGGVFSGIMTGATGMLAVAGGAFIALGGMALKGAGAAVKVAGDFQESLTRLYTTAGETKTNLKMLGDGILNMSGQVGTGSQKLVEAMYWIESGGLHGSQGLEALRVAAQAAKAENADLDKVSIALAASLNAYAGSGMSTTQVMNTLTAATGQGMMTFEQLSGSLASVLPASAKFGISLNNVTAALATMTAQGDPAEQAATHLKQVILALEAPSKAGASALKSVGLTSAEVASEMKKSLPDALKMITDAVGKRFPEGSSAYNQALKNIAGGSKQMMGFLELTGSHMQKFADNVGIISGAVKKGGNDLMGWADIQKNFNFQVDSAKASVEAFGIKIGTALLPVATQLMSFVAGVALPALLKFSDWFIGIATPALEGFSKTIQVFVQPAITAMTGLFNFLSTSAQKSTLDMQMKTVATTLDMAKKNVANIQDQRQGILDQLTKTTDAHHKAFLEMQLSALNLSSDQAKGVVANYEKQRQGIQNQLDAINPQAQLASLRTKDTLVSNTITMTAKTIDGYAQMRQGILQQLSQTTDASKRDALKRELDAIDAATKQKVGVLNQLEQQRQGIEAKMKGINAQAGADSANPFINAWKGAVAWFQGIPWSQIFGNINNTVTQIANGIKSVDWGGIFTKLWTTMQQIGNYLTTNFGPVWFQMGDEWKTVIAPALSQLNDALSPLYPLLKDIMALGFIDFIGRVSGTIKAIAGFISGFTVFVGGLVLTITGWVQQVSGSFQFLYDLITGNWKKLGDDLKLINKGMENVTKGTLTMIAGLWLMFWNTVSGYVSGFVDGVKNSFKWLSDTLVGHSIVPDMINAMVDWFKNLGPRALKEVKSGIKNITDAFTGMANNAFSWGHSLMSGFISGIQGSMGSLGATMQNVVGYIGSFLPHSPAKQGELQHLNEYGPAFVKGFADGILKNQPVLQSAMQVLVSPSGKNVAYPIQAHPGIVASVANANNASSNNNQGQTIIFEVDSVQLAKIVNPGTDRIVRLKLGPHGRAAA